jgi:hypothetical protein
MSITEAVKNVAIYAYTGMYLVARHANLKF